MRISGAKKPSACVSAIRMRKSGTSVANRGCGMFITGAAALLFLAAKCFTKFTGVRARAKAREVLRDWQAHARGNISRDEDDDVGGGGNGEK